MTTIETNRLLAERKERARAFIGQALKPGRAWSSLTYVYDREQDSDQEIAQKRCAAWGIDYETARDEARRT